MGLSLEEIEKIQEGLFPSGSVERDGTGQVVIYTGLYDLNLQQSEEESDDE